MRRREFIGLLGGAAAAWPLAAVGQVRVRRIGVLSGLPENDPAMKARLQAFRSGLDGRGWTEGRNIQLDIRYAPAGAGVQDRARELVALQPDLIFANSTPMARALQRETQTIPIVFVAVSDPIGSGFVTSLARPGGNLTGLLLIEDTIAGKWMGLLKEIDPRLKRVLLLANPKTTPFDYFAHAATTAAASLKIEFTAKPVAEARDIQIEMESFSSNPGAGLMLPPDTTIIAQRELIVRLAAQHRMPAISALRDYVSAGGLMSYGTDREAEFRQAADYVDRIFKDESPADLPVQAPTKYQFAINLKTAKSFGLNVPPTLLARADEVIE
jgi:putative ABC transport system substrate-binding protein